MFGGCIFAEKKAMKNTISILPCDTAVECRNLRIADTAVGKTLVATGTPHRVCRTGGAVPLFTYSHTDGSRSLFLHAGSRLSVLIGDADTPIELATLPSAPLCATAYGETVIVMTGDGAFHVDYSDGVWSPRGLRPEFPAVTVKAVAYRDFTAVTEPRMLSGAYSHWSGSLTADDISALTADNLDAYTRAAGDALAAGCFVQPVAVRYRLRDSRGALLYESPVVMVSLDGFQGCGAVEPEVTDRTTVASYALTLRGYRLALASPHDCPPIWSRHVATMELLVSPQIHPVDFSAEIDYRCQDGTTADTIRIALPGTSVENVTATDHRADMVAATANRLDSCARTIVIAYPFLDGIASTDHIRPASTLTPRQEAAVLKSALEKKIPTPTSSFISALSSFNSKTVHTVGDTVVWGDISVMRHPGHPIHAFAAETTDGTWRACITIEMSDGVERVVWHGSGTDAAPVSLSPLLSYPSADARSMTISLMLDDGITRKASYPLTPTENGNVAYYIDPSLKAISIPEVDDDFFVPASTITPRRYAGMVLAAATETPLSPFASLDASQGAVTAISSAVRSSSSWDFGRAHMYLFTTAGIYALAVTRSRRLASCQLLDRRPVTTRDAVTVTPSAIIAIAAGDLVEVTASRVKTIVRRTDYRAIGYNSAFDELLCLRNDSTLLVRNLSCDYLYRRDITPIAFYYDGTLHAVCADTLLDMSVESPTDAINVTWQHRIRTTSPTSRISLVAWSVYTSAASMSLSLRGDHGGNTPLPLLNLSIEGSVNAPVSARIIAPAHRYLSLTLSGTVAPDFSFESVKLHLNS